MADFTFVTSNLHKVKTAGAVCNELGITFVHQHHDLVEIQADNGEAIAEYKIQQAYEYYQKPVAITDDSWIIPGLRGFPGPYMKYINQWFEPADFVRLTKPLLDRRIFMRHIIAYQDDHQQKIFSVDIPGTLLKTARGQSIIPHFTVVSLDGQHSVAEAEADGSSAFANQPNAWHDFCTWFRTQNK